MTREQFLERMRAIWQDVSPGDDLQWPHQQADALMCEMLRQLGYGEGVDIFEKADKWYV